jgi:hypothetical protein
LQEVEDTDPLLDNLLSLGFRKTEYAEGTVFETDEDSFFKIGAAYAEVMGGFPFALRKVTAN